MSIQLDSACKYLEDQGSYLGKEVEKTVGEGGE